MTSSWNFIKSSKKDFRVSHCGKQEANKRFDFFLFPGQRHGYGDIDEYFFWLRGEYFCRHLLGDTRAEVDITEMNLEKEQNGK